MENLIIFQVIIFIVFLGNIWLIYGIQPSVSDSWYALKKVSPLFTLFLWAIGIPMFIIGGMLENWFYILSGICLCFTGAAAEFKQKITKTVHVMGAIGSILFVFLGLLVDGYWIATPVYTLLILPLYAFRVKNLTWWVESAAFAVSMRYIYIQIQNYVQN